MSNYKAVMQALLDAGFEAYLVGGTVRDHMMGRAYSDIDMTTNATPEQMQVVFTDKDFRIIPTGIKHGTLTIMHKGESFEITTFRHDVTTDGRNATVRYAKTMAEDAQRRDFTVNSLYMDIHGEVFDPTGRGVNDANASILRFVGDADQRCKEDYLRIFRLFRFRATLGFKIDSKAMQAAVDNIDGIGRVSDERKWVEIKKMLEGPYVELALNAIESSGLHKKLFYPHKVPSVYHTTPFFPVYYWHEVYYTLFGSELYPSMSKAEKVILFAYRAAEKLNPVQIAYMMAKQGFDMHDIFAVAAHWHKRKMTKTDIMGGVRRGMAAVFPLKSSDFSETGPALGKAMREAETQFVQSLV